MAPAPVWQDQPAMYLLGFQDRHPGHAVPTDERWQGGNVCWPRALVHPGTSPAEHGTYSSRKAATGSRPAARIAGVTPESWPIATAIANASNT